MLDEKSNYDQKCMQSESAQAQYAKKKMAAEQQAGAALSSALGRQSLRERVRSQFWRAQTEARRSERLAELDALLEKHPDIARILDLIEEIRA